MKDEVTEIISLLKRTSDVSLKGDTIQITVDGCSDEDRAMISGFIDGIKKDQPAKAVDYSGYFDEVKKMPLYKPGNPDLALMQVAKLHKLDLAAFKKAFRENK